jgi:hypothetical protein
LGVTEAPSTCSNLSCGTRYQKIGSSFLWSISGVVESWEDGVSFGAPRYYRPVIHVSQLKKFIGADVQVQDTLPDVPHHDLQPEMLLGTRWRHQGATSICQVLVRWKGLPDALATWENKDELKCRFPEYPAWGQAGSHGEGNVMDQVQDVAVSASGK